MHAGCAGDVLRGRRGRRPVRHHGRAAGPARSVREAPEARRRYVRHRDVGLQQAHRRVERRSRVLDGRRRRAQRAGARQPGRRLLGAQDRVRRVPGVRRRGLRPAGQHEDRRPLRSAHLARPARRVAARGRRQPARLLHEPQLRGLRPVERREQRPEHQGPGREPRRRHGVRVGVPRQDHPGAGAPRQAAGHGRLQRGRTDGARRPRQVVRRQLRRCVGRLPRRGLRGAGAVVLRRRAAEGRDRADRAAALPPRRRDPQRLHRRQPRPGHARQAGGAGDAEALDRRPGVQHQLRGHRRARLRVDRLAVHRGVRRPRRHPHRVLRLGRRLPHARRRRRGARGRVQPRPAVARRQRRGAAPRLLLGRRGRSRQEVLRDDRRLLGQPQPLRRHRGRRRRVRAGVGRELAVPVRWPVRSRERVLSRRRLGDRHQVRAELHHDRLGARLGPPRRPLERLLRRRREPGARRPDPVRGRRLPPVVDHRVHDGPAGRAPRATAGRPASCSAPAGSAARPAATAPSRPRRARCRRSRSRRWSRPTATDRARRASASSAPATSATRARSTRPATAGSPARGSTSTASSSNGSIPTSPMRTPATAST